MVEKILILIATILCASFQCLLAQNDLNCGIGGPPASLMPNGDLGVINGVDAAPHEFPWQGSIYSIMNAGHMCGCSILNKRWLITAAHCAVEMKTKLDFFKVNLNVLNITKIDNSTIEVFLSNVFIHPNYNDSTINNDVALLKMNRDLDLHNPDNHIGSICLPEQDEPMDKYVGKSATTTGWGIVTFGDIGNFSQTNEILKKVNLTIWRQSFCKDAYSDFIGHIYDEMICASGYEKGSCYGDSGGPLVNYVDGRWILQGIVSWGDPCALPYHPSVYTRVSKFVDWIWKTVQDN